MRRKVDGRMEKEVRYGEKSRYLKGRGSEKYTEMMIVGTRSEKMRTKVDGGREKLYEMRRKVDGGRK